MKKTSVKRNFLYNMLYQLFTMLVPLITTPYISKVLLPEGVGKYSYTYSIVNYFILFSQLGLNIYGQREIAKYQDNKLSQSIIFFEILIIKLCTVSISCMTYILVIPNSWDEYGILFLCWLPLILAQLFDISFLFQGNENFSKIVFRNFTIKIIGILSIFIFVKSYDDVWIYILSVSLSNLFGIISTWFYLPQYIVKINVYNLKPLRHVLPSIKLFIPTIATVIYAYLDKTLIGVLINDTFVDKEYVLIDGVEKVSEVVKRYSEIENGYYEQSEKILKVSMSIITALGAVMLPRNTHEFASGNHEKLKNNIYTSAGVIFMLGMPLTMGLVAISENLIPWFLGEEFSKCIIYLRFFSPLVILFGLDNVFGIQYLITTNNDKKYSIAIITGTIINILLNLLLIPKFWGLGAIIASIIAEIIIVLIMYLSIKQEISFARILYLSYKYILASCIMYIFVYFTQINMNSNIMNTFILIIEGCLIYFGTLIVLKDKLFYDNFIYNRKNKKVGF